MTGLQDRNVRLGLLRPEALDLWVHCVGWWVGATDAADDAAERKGC